MAILLWLAACDALSQPLRERVILFTDRNLYISGEPIQFSAVIKPENDSSEISRILYCELITSAGRRMAEGKYSAVHSAVTGNLVIPPDLMSGVYYLKAYTKSMRNEGPSVYSYDNIKIVNPDRGEVNAAGGDESGAEVPVDMVPDTMIRSSVKVPSLAFPGDTITILNDSSICRTLENLTISVIPGYTFSDRNISPHGETVIDNNFYLPETQGILITGIVKDRSDGRAVPGINVNLSITGEGRDFMPATTGNDGRFVFSLPDYTGNRDIFLCTESTDSLDAHILVDNDFCSLPADLPEEEFELSGDERETALRMAVNFRLYKYFNVDSVESEGNSDETPVFYGTPDEMLSIDEFIQLPTLEEYFNQLPVPVKVRKRSGQKYFKVLGTQSELMEIDPLVMVDLVVIDDPEKILALDPRDISRIDIVNSLYVKGDRIYGGVVNFISKGGDFAGISLPSSGVFINYSFLSHTAFTPMINGTGLNGPDTRNTVFWKVIKDRDECSGISFIAPEAPGKYLVVIRGVDKNGEVASGSWTFNVQKK